MVKLRIKDLKNTYKANSIYIFKFKDLSILGSYIKNENNIYIFEIADLSYEMLLDIKIKPNESIISILKNGTDSPVLKENISFYNFIF